MKEMKFNDEATKFLMTHINEENEKYIKALVLYFFIMSKQLSYEQVAELLNIKYIDLLDMYDELKVSTNEITLPEVEKLFIKHGLIDKEYINELNKKEDLLCL